jgi:multidrug efflux pump
MTTGAMVLGAVPLAYATGAGSESRMQIGLVIVGGMTFGTVLTLFVVPVVYSLLARRRTAIAEAAQAGASHRTDSTTGVSAAPATVTQSVTGPAVSH